MNRIQQISHNLESARLKMQMGLAPDTDIDIHALRAIWRQLQVERRREKLRFESEKRAQTGA